MSAPEPRAATATERTTGGSRPAAFAGLAGGLIGATCCVGPAIGVATGAGAGSFLLAMGTYRPHLFVVGGLISLAIAAVLIRRRRAACPTRAEYRALRSRWIDVALIVFAITYGVGRFVVTGIIERL